MASEESTELKGKLFAPGSGAGVVCTVRCDGDSLFADVPAGTTRFPLEASTYAFGGSGDAMLVVEHAGAHLYVARQAIVPELRRHGIPALDRALGAAEGQRRSRGRRGVALSAALVLSAAALAWGANGVANWGIGRAVHAIPPSFEVKIGRRILEAQFPERDAIDDPVILGAVQTISERLLAEAATDGFELTFRVVDEPELNAFALPGGSVVVLSGLLAHAESPEEVAGVLAHEIQHVLHRHVLEGNLQSLKWSLFAALVVGDVESLGEALVARSASLVAQAHGRDAEREADLDGLALLHRARIRPDGMIRFFERMVAERDGPTLPAFLSTHPVDAERVRYLRARAAELGDPGFEPLDVDWDAVHGRLGRWDDWDPGADDPAPGDEGGAAAEEDAP